MEYLSIRILCSLLTGIILSQTGSLIQLGTRNILASPSTLGFDGLSILWLLAFHSLILFFSFETHIFPLVLMGLPIFFLIGYGFSRVLNRAMKFEKIILLGLTFNLLVGAIFSLWQFFFLAFNLPFPVELWFGHFRYSSWESLVVLITVVISLLVGLSAYWKEMLLYSLGTSLSNNYRLKSQSMFLFLFISISIGTFVVVGLFGAFSFLGLVFPIVSRKLWFERWDLKGEILIGGVVNGIILMLIDLICYHFPIYGAEVPVGLIMSAIGAVGLILLLWQSQVREILAKPAK